MTDPEAAAPVGSWIIDHAKIALYLLNTRHKDGASKAKYLMAFGFGPDDPHALAKALAEHPANNAPGREIRPSVGLPRLVFEGPMDGPDGRRPRVRTVWERTGPGETRFITLVPLTR